MFVIPMVKLKLCKLYVATCLYKDDFNGDNVDKGKYDI